MLAYGSIHFPGGPVGSLGASAGVRVGARSVDAKRLDRARVARLERSSTPRVPAASAIGARVWVTAGGLTQTQEVVSGSSYLSQSDFRLFFGLGKNAQVERVRIRWPGGTTETRTGLAANRLHRLAEGEGVSSGSMQ